MFITAERIAAMEPRVNPAVAAALATELDARMPEFGITSLLSRAHFMAQAAYETAGFTRFVENLHYSIVEITACWPRLAGRAADLVGDAVAIANAAYANKNGNGDEASGDGFRFIGRGIFQLTGRGNYRRAGDALKADYVAHPDLVAHPIDASRTALWYWQGANLGFDAERDDVDAITRAINGKGMQGAFARRQLTEKSKTIFV